MIKPVFEKEIFIDLTEETRRDEQEEKTEQILEKAEEVGLKIHKSEEKYLGACTITWCNPYSGKEGIVSVPEEMIPEFFNSLTALDRSKLVERGELEFFLKTPAEHMDLGSVLEVSVHNKAVNLDEFNLHFGDLHLRDIIDSLKGEKQ